MRTKQAKPREIEQDPKYKSTKVAKLINRAMKDGKKSVAQKQVYKAFEIVEKKLDRKAMEIFEDVVNNVVPKMEVRSRRVGGAAYQVPVPVKSRRAFSLAVRWLVEEARKRSNKTYHTFSEKLAAEMMDILNNQGGAMQKKFTSHRMAEANKAFAHFRW